MEQIDFNSEEWTSLKENIAANYSDGKLIAHSWLKEKFGLETLNLKDSYRMIRMFETFAGYGSQSMAMKRLGLEFEVVGISEIDQFAIQAYYATHDRTIPNYGDICKIDWESVPDFDLLTMSSPCQDFSCAGEQRGGEKGSGTRSSLLWECEKAITIKRPKYILFENVTGLISEKFIKGFQNWQLTLSRLGYTNFSQVLNAKDYGVPQSRDRIFMVSVLNCDKPYYFPEPIPLTKRLKDILETNVSESYFLSDKLTKYVNSNGLNGFYKGGCGITDSTADATHTLTANYWKTPRQGVYLKVNQVGNCVDTGNYENPTRGRIYDTDGLSPTINAMGGGGREPKILSPKRTEYGKAIRKDYEKGNIQEKRKNIQQLEPRSDGVSNTITTVLKDNLLSADYRIRKLTERECFRLMDVSEEDIDKIQASGLSKTQQYRIAGNSIVCACLVGIFRKLFIDTGTTGQLKLF